jgi:hypothetical protein
VQQADVLAVAVGVPDDDGEGGGRHEPVELSGRVGAVAVEKGGGLGQRRAAIALVLAPPAVGVGISGERLAEVLLVQSRQRSVGVGNPVEPGHDQALHAGQFGAGDVDGGEADVTGEAQAGGFGRHQAGAPPIVDLEDVGGRATVHGPSPATVTEVDQEQLVLEASRR